MRSFIVILFFTASLCSAQTAKVIRLYDSTDCRYAPKIEPAHVFEEENDIIQKMAVTGTITVDWGPDAGIGQDLVTAVEIARNYGQAHGATAIVYVSSTEYKNTGDIATLTYRMYAKECTNPGPWDKYK